MDHLEQYFVTNIFLIVISAIMVFIAIFNHKQRKRTSIYIFAITGLTVFLSITETLEVFFKEIASVGATTAVAFLQYVLRPACVVLFIFFSKGEPKGKRWLLLFVSPLIINLIIFILAFIPGVREQVFYFVADDMGGIVFQGGVLRFSSHIVGGLYLIYFLFTSVRSLKAKHMSNALIILVCVLLIVACVVIETFFNDGGDIHILNTGIMICVMSYYLFLFIERVKRDSLTGLFSRSTYYQDILRMELSCTAVIQFDLNGLKYLNDNFGHEEGDKALVMISKIIFDRCNKEMYAYRLGGDEFIVLVNNLGENEVQEALNNIKEDISKTDYTCSIGVAYKKDRNVSINDLTKEAEKEMYISKAEYYKSSNIERRQ